jgi:hypothetical protein
VRDPLIFLASAPVLALAIFKQGRQSEAVEYLHEIRESDRPIGSGMLGLINLGLGLLSVQLDDLERAELTLQEALNCNNQLNVGLYWLGVVQIRLKKPDAAISSLTKSSQRDHDLRTISKIMLADAYSMKAVFANSLELYEEVVRDPAWTDFVAPGVKNLTLDAYARLLLDFDQFDANLSLITDQLDDETSYELLLFLGQAAHLSGCWTEYENFLQQIVVDYPGSKVSLFARYLTADDGEASKLLTDIETFLINSDSQEILAIWSELKFDLETDYSDVIVRLSASWLPDGDASSIRVGSLLYLARRLADKGDAAADVVERLIDCKGKNLTVSTCPARNLHELGEFEIARDIAQAFISKNDDDFWSHYFLGMSQLETEDYSMGAQSLLKASKLVPNHFGFLDAYVRAELKFGSPQTAKLELLDRINLRALPAAFLSRADLLIEEVEEHIRSSE